MYSSPIKSRHIGVMISAKSPLLAKVAAVRQRVCRLRPESKGYGRKTRNGPAEKGEAAGNSRGDWSIGGQDGFQRSLWSTEQLKDRKAGENFAAQAEQHGQEFDLDLPSESLTVLGNPVQTLLALVNLLDNAVKFTATGGSTRLRLSAVGTEVEISVSDTDIGLSPEDLDQVFRRFHRGRNADSFNGTGLGLAIVQAIVQVHGGRVWAANNPEGGSSFTIRLPAAKSPIV